MLYSISVFLTILICIQNALDIMIKNPGFELDPIGSDNTYLWDGKMPSDWERYDPNNVMKEWNIGIVSPQGGTSFNDNIFGDSSPEGSQNTYMDTESHKSADEFGLVQELTGNVVTADTTYTLSVWIGNPDSNKWSKNSQDGDLDANEEGFGGYRVQLVANGNILAEDDNSLAVDEGTWKQSVVTVTISSDNPNIGQTLQVRIMNKNANSDSKLYHTGYFDYVQLKADTSPISFQPSSSTTSLPSVSAITFQPITDPTIAPVPDPTIAPVPNPTIAPVPDPTVDTSILSTTTDVTKKPTLPPLTSNPSNTLLPTTHLSATPTTQYTTEPSITSSYVRSHATLDANSTDWIMVSLVSFIVLVCITVLIVGALFGKHVYSNKTFAKNALQMQGRKNTSGEDAAANFDSIRDTKLIDNTYPTNTIQEVDSGEPGKRVYRGRVSSIESMYENQHNHHDTTKQAMDLTVEGVQGDLMAIDKPRNNAGEHELHNERNRSNTDSSDLFGSFEPKTQMEGGVSVKDSNGENTDDNKKDDIMVEMHGRCNELGCKCDKYVENPSKWSKGKCKTCDHSPIRHKKQWVNSTKK